MNVVNMVKNYVVDGFECAITHHEWPEIEDYFCGYLKLSKAENNALLNNATASNAINHGISGKEVSFCGDSLKDYFRDFKDGDVILGFDLLHGNTLHGNSDEAEAKRILNSWIDQVKKAVAKDTSKHFVWNLGNGSSCAVKLGL